MAFGSRNLVAGIVFLLACIALNMSLGSASETGFANYYERPYTPSSCYGNKDSGPLVAQAADHIYQNGERCGHTVAVSCNGGAKDGCLSSSIIQGVTIVDRCSDDCGGNDFSLSQESFSVIGDPTAGSIPISYTIF